MTDSNQIYFPWKRHSCGLIWYFERDGMAVCATCRTAQAIPEELSRKLLGTSITTEYEHDAFTGKMAREYQVKRYDR